MALMVRHSIMIKIKRVILTLFLSCSQVICAWAEDYELRVQKPQSDIIIHDYYEQLLYKALERGANGRPVPNLREVTLMEQGRATSQLLEGGLIDVYWVGTDITRETLLRPIRIPLDRGLLGFRQFVIHRDMLEEFEKVKTLEDLKKYTACQGLHWPDTEIMRASGLEVKEVSGFEHIYKLLMAKRCDYFPRGIAEANIELASRKSQFKDLMVYEPLILHYPFTIYFFVNTKNETLAQWISQGLDKLIDTGEMDVYMKSHPYTSHIFPLKPKSNTRYIEIPNPYLSKNTDFHNSRYWAAPPQTSAN